MLTEILWYLAGLATIPAAGIILGTAGWAFQKTTGTGECMIDGCTKRELELGEHFNITVWAHSQWHTRVTNSFPRHRNAVLAHWQAQKDKGFPVHPKVRRKLR
ncbi:MAG TPA: hypothetical protein VJQ80_01255 [Arthrobacter sp.]|nr:hypothetical protein [Arthrobacter sp.]